MGNISFSPTHVAFLIVAVGIYALAATSIAVALYLKSRRQPKEDKMGDNQTKDKEIAKNPVGKIGTGIFAIPDPESREPDRIKKVAVGNITYLTAVQLGRNCVAFRWVGRIIPVDELKCPMEGELCKDSCASDLCLCVEGACR